MSYSLNLNYLTLRTKAGCQIPDAGCQMPDALTMIQIQVILNLIAYTSRYYILGTRYQVKLIEYTSRYYILGTRAQND